jgi:hypothetical protein
MRNTPDKGRMASISRPEEVLIGRQSAAGGWSFFQSTQISVEATCLALLALSPLKQTLLLLEFSGLPQNESAVSEQRYAAYCEQAPAASIANAFRRSSL